MSIAYYFIKEKKVPNFNNNIDFLYPISLHTKNGFNKLLLVKYY